MKSQKLEIEKHKTQKRTNGKKNKQKNGQIKTKEYLQG